MEWDDLRYFLELARSRTLTEAARRLDVKHTTVSRRIQRLELVVGSPLFNRTSSGHVLTPRGQSLLAEAQVIEEHFLGIDEEFSDPSDEISGVVRIGCSEGYGVRVLPPHLRKLQGMHPNLRIDLIVQPRPIQLARNEADIVITIDRPGRGPYLLTKLVDYTLRLYASPSYLAERPPIASLEDLQHNRFVSYIEESGPAKGLPAILDLVQSSCSTLRSTSIFAQLAAIAGGAGIGILPSYLANGRDDLLPVLGKTVVFKRTYWMFMPAELKRIARVPVVWRFLKNAAKERAAQFLT
ncbi:LysR family transcriptional regulator [Xanthobacter dioxanivorans]|uniref:LysR family transcriptional regulator n=1 Tax=Xanthobacter dioxanivorans TaxID=2528964 RepID=A0A974SK51_9HYPH|nr:LysR family transcriptional regulator [Xanthobacter dioxanivorans]QRG07884.1 LysR family transcriptional regulator [Xanthobacter dioxanivorans]